MFINNDKEYVWWKIIILVIKVIYIFNLYCFVLIISNMYGIIIEIDWIILNCFSGVLMICII